LAAPDESPSPSPSLPAGPTFPAIEIGESGRIDRADIPELCERVRVLLADDATDQLECDVGAITAPDAVTIDALARLQLTAKRLGCEVRIRRASPELRDLVAFMGLSGVIPLSDRSGLQARRQPEEGEQPVRGEEERDPADPAI
jgi:ABC-type transporter Mla MlaB component